MKRANGEATLQVPKELWNMAVDISFMGFGQTEKILEKALRFGLAHLLVLEEENAKWRMKQM